MRYLMVLALLLPGWLSAAIVGEEVHYTAGNTEMHGYLAYDSSIEGPRPGILVVHEWWGHNEYARSRARQLTELGYVALAIDMYGEGQQADHPQDAGKFASAVRNNMPIARERFEAAMAVLLEHPMSSGELAAIGYCFGGSIVLEMARRGLDLRGVVSFHGSLGTAEPARPGEVKAQVLVLNGADDPMVTAEQIAEAANGIGLATAQAIVERIAEKGPFLELDDLTEISGVGKSTVNRNRDNLKV